MKTKRATLGRSLAGSLLLVFLTTTGPVTAKPEIRDAFFLVYPSATDTQLDDLPAKATHCLVCHYKASGGGTKNPYGEAIKTIGNLNQPAGRIAAVNAVANVDSDADGYYSVTEVTGTGYSNTPTFPGLSSANYSLVNGVPTSQVLDYLTPKTTVDNTPPQVAVLTPNGGVTLTGNQPYNVTWSASDASGIVAIHIYQSIDGGLNYTPVIYGLENTGTYAWTPANRPTTTALIKVVAVDGAINTNNDISNSAFTIVSPPGGKVPTTLRDFDMPGTQPFEAGSEPDPPENCAQCHGGYDPAVEPYANWQGSMMALASRDPLFEANLAIANQDAPDSGDLCLRCHISGGWMQGRSVPTDGSAMLERDKIGVSCDLCHRMVDPVYKVDLSPARDQQVLADLSFPGQHYGNGMFVIDPDGIVRGPFDDAAAPHAFRASSFHKSSAFCGTCHDVSNPAFTKDPNGIYQPNTFDLTVGQVSPHSSGPVERTYSEWLNSEYATTGVHQPEFAGNKPGGIVSTCQDCHMRDVNAKGCNLAAAPTRPDMPLHDMTGGSTWVPQMIAKMYPDKVNVAAINAGVVRAKYMLQNAADLGVTTLNGKLKATVTNQTGHKLPTGYPEGRRVWLNVKFYNAENGLISESGAYNSATGVLSHDPEAKIYEVHPGIGENIAGVVGLPAGPSLHFVLNNKIFDDNRIPPRGFTNIAFAQFGGAPVGHTYADGQHWDDTEYTIPAAATRAEVRLFYQSTSKEFVEFLRDKNVTNNKGTILYNLWNENGKCPPELMVQAQWTMDPAADYDGDGMANSFEQEHDMNPFDAADALLDADDDGLNNLVESALGSDPTDAESTHRPEGVWVEVQSPAGRHFAVSYVRRVPNPNASIVVETSDDLVNWSSGALQTVTHEVIDHHDGTETVTERMLEPNTGVPASFMRVKVVPAGGP